MFWDKPIGISYPLFAIFTLILLWIGIGRERLSSRVEGWLLLVPLGLLAITFGYHTNPILLTINFLIIPPLLIVHAMMITDVNPIAWWRSSVIVQILDMMLRRIFMHFDKPFKAVSSLIRPEGKSGINKNVRGVLLGLLLALPLMLIVIPLLSSADLVFERIIIDVLTSLNLERFDTLFIRSIIVSFVLLSFFGFAWTLLHDKTQSYGNPKDRSRTWDPTTSITILTVTNIVYLAFTIVQIKYLYGGASSLLPEGFTYSEYARRGFWELLTVSAINLSLLLAFMAKVKETTRAARVGMNISLIALVLFAANLLFAAHTKMSLYEAVYGLTYLRLFVHYFMVLLVVLFALPLVHLISGRIQLVKSYLIAALSFYVVLNFLGVDQIIAAHNLDRYDRTGKIDVSHLRTLSDDAIPILATTRADLSRSDRYVLDTYMSNRKRDLSDPRPWQSTTISRSNALQALDSKVFNGLGVN